MLPLSLYRPGNYRGISDTVEVCLLTTTAQAFDIPAGAACVQFSSTATFGVKFGTASVAWPTTSSTAATAAEMIQPTGDNASNTRMFGSTKATTGFSLIAGAAGGYVSMSFFGP